MLVLILVGLKWLLEENKSDGGGMSKNQNVPLVEGILASRSTIQQSILLTGTLMPDERTDVYPEISGRVLNLYFKEGQVVQKGDILLKIQDADLQAQMRKIKAQLKQARAQEVRLHKLLTIQGVSKEEYETVTYQIEGLEADSLLVKSQLDKTVVLAPYSGSIGLREISPGAMVSPNTRLLTLQKNYPLKLDFTVPEKYAGQVQVGKSIHFSTQTDTTIRQARILATDGRMEENTRSLKVRGVCEQCPPSLLPGSFAKVQLDATESLPSFWVPTIAIVPVLKGQKLLVRKAGKVNEVRVQTGLRKEGRIQILDGLHEGDTVLISGILSLKPGMPVDVTLTNF